MKKIVTILCLWMLPLMLLAVPARREGFLRTAPDGTEKMVWLHGNEHFHYMTDAEGNWLDETTLAPMSLERKNALLQAAQKQDHIRRAAQQTNGIGDKPNIAPRGLVVLVNFTDVTFTTPRDTIDSLLNARYFPRTYSYDYHYKDDAGTEKTYHADVVSEGSARKYFYDQSYGQYNPQFDLIGPLTIDHNMAYYGTNNSQGSDKNAVAMIIEACQKADNAGVDFSQYDNNNDGYVDFVYVIYAGFGESDGGPAESVWPHQWDISARQISHDNKKLGRYACGSELSFWSKLYAGIGTFCHEFSHVLGLPDLYETVSQNVHPHTLYEWDIMDYGPYNNDGNTPPAYSAYERFYLGWLTPRLLQNPENVTLNPINEGNGSSLMISTANTHNMSGWNPSPTEYYLLEARNKEGWDTYLPGEGMLITKVTFSSTTWHANTVNNNYRSMGIDIMEAASNTTRGGKATDAYPAGATQWTGYQDHEVTEITRDANTGVVSFKYRGGGSTTAIENKQDDHARCTKVIRDGQLLILRGGKTYDLQGRLLAP